MTPVITDFDFLQPDNIAGVEAIYGNPTPDAPAISSALNAATVDDQPFTYQITAMRTPPTNYQADGLPPGLSVDPATGIISGTPTQAGSYPNALTQAADGNFYGTTFQGGSGGRGTVFKVTADGVFTTLHEFGATESGYPTASLVQGSDGSLYGSGYYGEASGGSTVFKVDNAGDFTTVHVFVSKRGEAPSNPLVQGIDGNIYGMTGFSQVGSGSSGTIYRMTPGGELTTLHQFVISEGRGGSLPMMPDATGYLYGLSDSAFFRVGTSSVAASSNARPAITLSATTPQVVVNSGATGVFTINLSEAQSTDVVINYTVKGTALNGTDYVLLKDTKEIKAGKTTKAIKINPLGDLGGVAKKTVVLILVPSEGYTVGTSDKVKVKIVSGP